MGNGAATADRHIATVAVTMNEAIERLLPAGADDTGTPRMVFISDLTADGCLEAVILWPQGTPLLADVATTFEHLGLRVADRVALELPVGMHRTGALYDFTFLTPAVWRPESLARVSDAFSAHASDGFDIDGYASLIVAANLSWRDVVFIRAASRFVRQAGLGLSENYVIDTLLRHSGFVVALVNYFESRFDPNIANREPAVAAAETEVLGRLDAAATLDEDRILRSLESFVTACVRTNWYQVDASGAAKKYASFKLDSSKLALAGPVLPYREIFVYADDVEGVHLRAGAVARGGLRYSDRPEDYRTEALGLMKTQNVKNSPIVPVGAKGAFVRKNPAITPAEAYTIFIRGLLDVTDNLVDNVPVPPARTITYDTPDTYLVVAADKGTASFSDLANTVALDAGYWLGDAFASGGSSGYDHKAMGITARGAWVSVRRHFDELGIDVATDPVTVVGIGDMSGDVFGNGMLMSKSMKLVAAFDHRHIFIDPNPDPAASFTERQRLFALAGTTSWNDYDRDALSPGAGIWPRTAKKISLSPQAQTVLGLDNGMLSPNELIKAILRAPVDLLWNGGIGTYVRASDETHTDAADPVNDSVRVSANELRCAVIGEGGNLGLTQRARVEFALAGGRLNADFIDNAAGVATSDLEVNLKIALDVAVAAGRIDRHQRNRLLAESLEDVSRVVLDNSESQTLAISLAESQAPMLLNRHERLIGNLERNGISRTTEVLPTKKELASRTEAGLGLTRPEIAVLLAQSKNIVCKDLLDSTVPEEPVLASSLQAYFPERIRTRLPAEINEHHLAREIIATKIADDLINHVGPGLIHQLDERLGVKTPDVARAYAVVRAVFDVDRMWEQAQRSANDGQRWDRLHAVQHFIEQTASWILRRRPAPLDVAGEIDRYAGAVRELMDRRASDAATDELAELRFLAEVFDLIETARARNQPVEAVADIHSRTDALLGLSWLTSHMDSYVTTNRWDSMAASTVRDDLARNHHVLVGAILESDTGDGSSIDPIDHWQSQSAVAINRFSRMMAELRRDGVVDIARACTAGAELGLLVRSTRELQAADLAR